jgi:hypothetical protein
MASSVSFVSSVGTTGLGETDIACRTQDVWQFALAGVLDRENDARTSASCSSSIDLASGSSYPGERGLSRAVPRYWAGERRSVALAHLPLSPEEASDGR